MTRRPYWDEWQEAAEAYMKGKTDEPPDSPNTQKILALVATCREVDRVLNDPRSTVTMPATAKRLRKLLREK